MIMKFPRLKSGVYGIHLPRAMGRAFFACLVCAATSCFAAGKEDSAVVKQEGKKSGEPYYSSSETAPWYDSYGRLRRGYGDAPIKGYPRGKEPYYHSSERAPWYDSYGRLRQGPRATEMKPPPPGKEPYYYYSDHAPWYDSYGRLRYGPKGIPAGEYDNQKSDDAPVKQ
ncbi:MAG: hypothetical protein NT045_03515 [Candidatus Aureabacteria bacterium]|nr:hypothetical protein [Candidatus Auribacterota bacterium]